MIGRIVGLSASLIILGCAHNTIRTPCEFDVHVLVLDAASADEQCHKRCRRLDNGDFVEDADWLQGCSGNQGIRTVAREDVAGHELMHKIQKNCGKGL